nr:hypothetical protein GCM10020093_064970 [Planobispora longispora]
MSKATFRERSRYWFDNTMSRGTGALIGWLAAISVALIVVVSALVLWLTPVEADKHHGVAGVLWATLMRTLSPGKVASDTGSAPFIALMFAASLGGLIIVSALVGVLANGFKERFERLRKGRSRIIERGHIVILGWSDQVFTIVKELVEAHASRRGSTIAILADLDKVAMEDALRTHVGDTGRTRVVCRTGRPVEPADLDLMNLDAARSVVVLSPQGEDPDAHVIKTLLALDKRAGDHPRWWPRSRAPATWPPPGSPEARTCTWSTPTTPPRGSSCSPPASRAPRWSAWTCSTSPATRSICAPIRAWRGRSTAGPCPPTRPPRSSACAARAGSCSTRPWTP